MDAGESVPLERGKHMRDLKARVEAAGLEVADLVRAVVQLVVFVVVAWFLAYGITWLVTGWRSPGPDVAGCGAQLSCAEGSVFFPVWLSLVVIGSALRWQRHRARTSASR